MVTHHREMPVCMFKADCVGDREEGMEVAHSNGVRATILGFEVIECVLPSVSSQNKHLFGYTVVRHDNVYMDIRHESIGRCSPCLIKVPFPRRLRLCIA